MLDAVRALPAGAYALARAGEEPGVYLVGGAVRDLLRQRSPRELDLVTEGDVEALAERFGGERRGHARFGTVTVVADGMEFDLARTRSETYAHPGALPEIAPAPLDVDLLRRDFTVNAIALALNGSEAGVLVAAPSALEDLDARVLRVLHAASFRDDPTRLLRLARYAARLDFTIEPGTQELVAQALGGGALGTVSAPRIGNELRLLAHEDNPLVALARVAELGIGAALDPAFRSPDRSVAAEALALLPADGRADLLALGLSIARPNASLSAGLDRLAFTAAERRAILDVAGAESLAVALRSAVRPAAIAEVARGHSPEAIAAAGALGAREPAQDWLGRLRHIALEIDGDDMVAAGIAAGPAVGAGLRGALAAKLDGRLDGREHELAEALRVARSS